MTEYETGRVFAHKGKGGSLEFASRFVVDADRECSHLVQKRSVGMSGLYKLLEFFSTHWTRRSAETALRPPRETLAVEPT